MPDALRRAIAERDLPVLELPSGAGHDAGILASAGVDAAMLFVRSLNGGVSHSPDELSSDEDVALVIMRLAGRCIFNGELERGLELSERGLDIAEALQLDEILIRGWTNKAAAVLARLGASVGADGASIWLSGAL